MPRNRQLFRPVHRASTSKKDTAQADPPQPRRRDFRRFALAAAFTAIALVVTQVVLAVPPDGVNFTISNASPTRGQSVTFNASAATDPDGGTITSYAWDFGDGTTGSGQSASHAYANSVPAGQKTVTLTVTDSANETTTVTQSLQVVNVPPTAAVSCTPSIVAVNVATSCNSNGSSDSEGPISYAWDSDGDGFDDGSDPTEQFSFPTSGPQTIRLRVTDSDNAQATAQQSITVSNPAPTASFTFSPSNPTVNQTVSFNGSASSDPEGQTLTYAWDLDGDGEFNEGSGPTASRAFTTGGNKTVQLRVTDPQNNSDVETKIVPVANRAPVASFNFAGTNPVTPSVPDVGEGINFVSTATDPDGDDTVVDWDWDLDGNGTFEASGQTIQYSFDTAGNKTVGLRVTDSSGASNSTTRTVTVNALPVANIGILNDEPENGQKRTVPRAGQPFAFTAGAVPAIPASSPAPGCPPLQGSPAGPGSSDAAPGSIATYQWDFDYNGTFAVDATGQNVASPVDGYPAGPRTVALRVIDNDGGVSPIATLNFRVNTPPTPGFVFQPDTPVINTEVAFTSSSTDPDAADAGKLTYSWDLDNDGVFCEQGETTANVKRAFPTANMETGHPVTLRVTDDGGLTRPVTNNVFVQNTVPAGEFSFSPDAPVPGQQVTFTGTSTATAGKTIIGREWDFDYRKGPGNPCMTFVPDAAGGSPTHSFPSSGPRTVAFKVTEGVPPGGLETGGCVIVTQTVDVNAPPRAGFTVSPEEAFVGDGVTLSSTSADPDGPLVRQDWDLDGDGQFDDANAAVVSANFTNPGLRRLALRVTDSRGATSTATGQVVIRTRPIPPTPPTPLLSGVLVELRAAVYARYTKVRGLLVRAPSGSKITVRCKGKSCPKLVTKTAKGSKKLRFKKLQRKFKPGVKLIVTVTKNGFIGKQTRWTIRRRKAPLRQDLCMNPGAKKAGPCPSG